MKTDLKGISTMEQLRAAVVELEERQAAEGKDLHDGFLKTYQSIRPVNLIKTVFNEVTGSQDLKDHLVSTGVGIVAGHVSKKAFESVSDSPAKQLLGTAIQFGVTNMVARHPEVVLAVGKGLFNMIRTIMRNRAEERAAERAAEQALQNPI